MTARALTCALLLALTLASSACMPKQQFYWGSYEDSLFSRQQHAGAGGEAEAAAVLLRTIDEAQQLGGTQNAGPGIHADYGYLLFKQGRPDEAIAELQKEAALYPESKHLMDTMISRIQARKDKKPTP